MLRKQRILALAIDYVCINVITYLVWIFLVRQFHLFTKTGFTILCFMVLIIFKDVIFRNASIGKRMLNIEVVKANGEKCGILRLIFRNIFVFLWYIEVILLCFKDQRLGDIVFKTKVQKVTS